MRQRGALIVIEGVDRSGKSTQCKALVDALKARYINVEYANFPARNTEVGKMINTYLRSKKEFPDEVIHLLFSANRWEKSKQMIHSLQAGTSLVVDRYCYSGVAFSAAKGLDINWCKLSDVGLPKPDKVFFLNLPLDILEQRKGFGDERYEVMDFQKKVVGVYKQLYDDDWEELDARRPIDSILEELIEKSSKVVDSVGSKPIEKLWLDCLYKAKEP